MATHWTAWMAPKIFQDRAEAARLLAEALQAWKGRDPVVFAIPRGAIPMGKIIADALGGQLDVVLTRKLSAPGNPELAVGAIGESGWVFVDPITATDLPEDYLRDETARQKEVIARRRASYTPARPPIDPGGRIAIVVDDGLATGATMIAALHDLRQKNPAELICAAPVASTEAAQRVSKLADKLVCLEIRADFWGVGQFYRDFQQVSDEEVMEILRGASASAPSVTA